MLPDDVIFALLPFLMLANGLFNIATDTPEETFNPLPHIYAKQRTFDPPFLGLN
jgi:hypothetical protein